MEESEDNMSAEDIKGVDLLTLKVKPKKRSIVERELETSLTARVTSPRTNGNSTSTSRYGRARRLKTHSESNDTEKIKPLKSPKIEIPVIKSPVYKMHASNSPIKMESPNKINLQCKLEHQIENIYNENISLSRFGSAEKKQVSPVGKTPKVYIRKDLIQSKEKEETVTLIKNIFSPVKPNSHLTNILERSSKFSSSKQNSYLDNSSVVKTLDFDGKKKKKDRNVKSMSKSDLFDLEAQCAYQVGDLAWARMGTYPYWPCIVTRDPVSGMFVKKKLFGRVHHDVIHVTFFGDNGRRSWIVDNMLRKFLGQLEFEATRERFTAEAKKKDPRHAAFIVSEKKLPQWNISVEEAETLLREPKRLRIDILNDMLNKSRVFKTTPKGSKKVARTNSDVSLSESLYDTLFSEDDCKTQDTEHSRSKTRKKSLDVSEVVTACLDNMAAKTGITKIQRQSHMDRWLEKAKSKTPEKTQLRSRISTKKVQNVKRNNKTVQGNELKKPFRFIINENDNESLDDSDSKLQSHHNEHDYSNKFSSSSPVVDLIDDNLKELPEMTNSDVGNIAKVERLNDVDPNSNNTQDDSEVLNKIIVADDIVVESDEVVEDTIDDTSSQNNLMGIQQDSVTIIGSEDSAKVIGKVTPKMDVNTIPEKTAGLLFNQSTINIEEIDPTTDASSLEITNSEQITDICDEILNETKKTEGDNIEINANPRIQAEGQKINRNNQEENIDNISMKDFNNQLCNGHDMDIDSEMEDSLDSNKPEKYHKSAVNVFTNGDTINSSMEWSINCEAEVTTSSTTQKNDGNNSKKDRSDVFSKSNKTDFLDEINNGPIGEDIVKDRPDHEGSKLSNVDVNEEANKTNLILDTQKREEENIVEIDPKNSDKKNFSEEVSTDDSKVSRNENIKKRNLSTPNIFLYDSADVSEDESVCSEIFYPSNAEETNNADTLIKDKNCLPLSLDEIINSPNKSNLDPILAKNCDSNESSLQGNNNKKQHINECHDDDDVACDDLNWSLMRVENQKPHQDTMSKTSKSSSTDTEKNMETNRIFDVTKEKSIGSLFRDFDKDNLSSKDSNCTTSDCDNENLDEPTESSEMENVDESTSDASVQNGYHESALNIDRPLEEKYGNFNIGSPIVNVIKLTPSDIRNAKNIGNDKINKMHNIVKISDEIDADNSSTVSTDSEVSLNLRKQVWKVNEQTLEEKISKNSNDTRLDCDKISLKEQKIAHTELGLNFSETVLQNGHKVLDRNTADNESSDKMDITDIKDIANTTLTEVNSKITDVTNENTEKSGHLINKIKEEVDAADTASTVSTESEMSLSIRRQRWKAEKQKSEKKAGGMEDPEFLKYVELKQDAIYDEHPELSQEEITAYLYNTWMYEESLKSDRQRTDDLDHANLAKGLQSETVQPKKTRKRVNKLDVEKYDVPVKQEVVPKQKTKRKTVRPFYNEELYDIDDDIEYFEIFRNKKQGIKIEKTEPEIGQTLPIEMQDVEEIDIVEEYFAQLTQPKPNAFKGLLREKVCEICEKTGNLVKCKGCHCMFHLDCVKKAIETVEVPAPMKGRKKKKKYRGRKLKTEDNFDDSNSDDKSHDTNVSEDANTSVENDMEGNIVANADDFEAQLALKMKELLGEEQILQYDSASSDDELDWSDTEAGKCEIVDIKLKQKKHDLADYSDFKCNNCQKYEEPVCFVCRSPASPKTNALHRQRCQVPHCNKYYHLECLEHWPQTQFNSGETARYNKKVNEYFEALSCPRHVCHTCVSDDPRGCKTRFSGDKLAKCVRCPATYHSFTKCLPAGSQILTASHIICPRHYEHRPGKVPCHVNTGWCFICALGGTLICCEYCPTSFHAECLNIKPPEGGYMCEDCETGRLPLYGEMVWVKLGHYRWWPGIILHPCEIPENILAVKHSPGEFVVRFFGQYDHYWVNRGRVFPFQEGDSGKVSSQKSKIDAAFTMAMEHAQRACEILKSAAPNEEESSDIASSLLPPHYVKLRVNKPCGSLVGRRADEEGSLTQCECEPADEEPCGPYSQCLNRMLLTECGPMCRAGDRCNNRAFEKRLYPKLVPYRTPHRGWGLKTLEDIKAGQFVIEYVGELIDEAEFERRMRRKHDIRDENFYFLTLDKERMIDAGPKGNLARFMNHCCEPNCETQKWTVLGDVRVGLFALYDIPANSEVTFNYNLESTGVEKKRCMCGAKRCSGYIGAKPKQSDPPKKPKVAAAKRTYKKRKIEDSPTTKPKPKLKQVRPIKPRELTEIEKDLLIIKSATNGISSDSECSGRLSSIESLSGRASKRRRAGFSTEDMSSNSSSPSTKRMRLEKCSEYDQNI